MFPSVRRCAEQLSMPKPRGLRCVTHERTTFASGWPCTVAPSVETTLPCESSMYERSRSTVRSMNCLSSIGPRMRCLVGAFHEDGAFLTALMKSFQYLDSTMCGAIESSAKKSAAHASSALSAVDFWNAFSMAPSDTRGLFPPPSAASAVAAAAAARASIAARAVADTAAAVLSCALETAIR